MSATTHRVAIFEEGFMLVAIEYEDIQSYGEKTIQDAIEDHPWVQEQGIDIVVVYQQPDDGEIRLFGPANWVDAVSGMNFDDIVWGHELTLEWED